MNIKEAREVLKDELRIAQGLGQLKVPPNKREQALTFALALMDKVDEAKIREIIKLKTSQNWKDDYDLAAQAIVKYLEGEPNG